MTTAKREEPRLPYQDSRWSWAMALVCSWCFFWTLIINRCGAIVFVTMISEMGASRELASWPFSLLGTVSHLVGPVWGALVKLFPLRTVAIAGSVLAASGIFFCVLFYNVTAMIIGLGVITAFGQGLVFPSLLVVINTHFKRYRASGMGICYTGGTLVSFVFPPLLLYLHEAYGLRGTLLILAGCSLNVTAGCLLANKPNDQPRPKSPVEEPLDTNEASGEHDTSLKSKEVLGIMREELSFLKNAMYFVVVATGIMYTYSFAIFNVTIVDFAIGKGLSKWEAAMLLPLYGSGDLLGRNFSGQLSDRKILQRRHVMTISIMGASAALLSVIYANSLALLGAVSFMFGIFSGSAVILLSILLAEYFGLERLAMAIGVSSFVNGIATFPRPLLIGFYRDRGKSYDGLYILLSLVTFGASVVWCIECFRQWVNTRRRKESRCRKGEAVKITEEHTDL
ncbi:monocarboxylate transporter, putative [Ixodes scapularis]|uniref:Monocarboxylate transporter, putative n=1 Tax=Ixodes scapularis TaxID=6945 RepID=B7QEA8_IXOSC|nr:monocarboxylate transporter, putative [Ixodes scapularis]|eukprot:XP_002413872.1 monocarboxylate transporter, putative [Ixodes scapularis]